MNYAERVAANEFDPWYQEHIARYHYLENFELGECVLDIACGNGVGSDLIAKNVERVFAIDQDPNTIENNRKFFSKTSNLIFKVDNAEHLDIDSSVFSAVVSFETIEHLVHPENFLQEIRRVLKPGGLFILSTPNARVTNPINGIPSNPFHIKEYTPTELNELLSKSFKIISMRGQSVSAMYPINYFWNPSPDRFISPKFYIWFVLHRLFNSRPILASNLAKLIFKCALYPDFTKWIFSEDRILESHDLFIVCKNVL